MSNFQVQFGWMGPTPIDIMAVNRTDSAVAVGDVEHLDNARAAAESTSNTVGIAASGVGGFVVPLLGDARGHYLALGIYGVVQQAVGDDISCKLRLRGQCDAVHVETDVVLTTFVGVIQTAKEYVSHATTVLTTTDGAVPHKVVFIPLTARTGEGLTDGWFDGINGFGSVLSVKGLT